MDSLVQYLCGQPRRRPAVSFSDQERLVAKDKADLDRLIAVKQGHGWVLLSRSYSMEEGHGAVVARKALGKAA